MNDVDRLYYKIKTHYNHRRTLMNASAEELKFLVSLLDMMEDEDFAKDINFLGKWISVKDKLPKNADHPGAFCPRYLVMTKYGRSEGWYNPDKGCWYTLVWFLIGRYTEDDIDMERGDIPKISSKIDVTHWMPLPEPPIGDKS